MPVDSDTIMYCDQHEIEDAIKVLVEKQNTVASVINSLILKFNGQNPKP